MQKCNRHHSVCIDFIANEYAGTCCSQDNIHDCMHSMHSRTHTHTHACTQYVSSCNDFLKGGIIGGLISLSFRNDCLWVGPIGLPSKRPRHCGVLARACGVSARARSWQRLFWRLFVPPPPEHVGSDALHEWKDTESQPKLHTTV